MRVRVREPAAEAPRCAVGGVGDDAVDDTEGCDTSSREMAAAAAGAAAAERRARRAAARDALLSGGAQPAPVGACDGRAAAKGGAWDVEKSVAAKSAESDSLCHAEVETGDGFAATVGAKNEVVAKSAESDSLCLAEVETGDVLAARVGAKRAREGAARSGATLVANVPALCRGINTPLRVRIKGAHLCWGGISMDLARATTRARAMAAALPRAPRVRVVFPKGAKGRGFWPPLVANIPPPRPKRSLVNQIVRVRPLVRIDGAPRPEDDRLWEYYFTMTYIPDLEWCFLAPLEECGTFSAEFGLAVKGRPRWKTVPEGQGRELHVSARRCTLVTANSVVKSKDADAEEWDIRDY